MRVGMGYDVHPFQIGRRLVLGGVEIPHSRGLAGHSDADVLLHAIADALLGAAALGDIGQHFPPNDPQYRDASSLMLLGQVNDKVSAAGFRPGNIDSTVVADEPRLLPYIQSMRDRVAEALGIAVTKVNIKATTSEGLGFVGRGEGIAAYAVAFLEER
jgi:2-C-methyl-D-erythritol 2,4-cyclodiphosphate synthase